MGTRNDFYIGRDPETMEWLGSQAYDGYPSGVFEDTGKEGYITPAFVVDEDTWRQEVNHYLSKSGSNTWPEEGWPWPWNDSNTTDYAYTYDDGQIFVSRFGSAWFPLDEEEEANERMETLYEEMKGNYDAYQEAKKERLAEYTPSRFPDMTNIKNVRRDGGSGIMLIGYDEQGDLTDLANVPVSNREGVEYPKAVPPGAIEIEPEEREQLSDRAKLMAIEDTIVGWATTGEPTDAAALYSIRQILG